MATIDPFRPHEVQSRRVIMEQDGITAEAARLATVRERLAGLLPVTTARQPTGDSLCVSLFPGAKPTPGQE